MWERRPGVAPATVGAAALALGRPFARTRTVQNDALTANAVNLTFTAPPSGVSTVLASTTPAGH
jgi:hypothetical protein